MLFYRDRLCAVDKEALRSALHDLGLRPGEIVFVHSSYDQMRPIRATPLEIIKILCEVVGDAGTIVMPTFPMQGMSQPYLDCQPVFDWRRTPSRSGLLTEVFRRMPGTERSLHPTHPVAARGAAAGWLTEGHEYSHTPFDEQSPFQKLLQRNALVLSLGRFDAMTFHHLADHLIQDQIRYPIYSGRRTSIRAVGKDGKERLVLTQGHNPNLACNHHLIVPNRMTREGLRLTARVGTLSLSLVRLRTYIDAYHRYHARGLICHSLKSGPVPTGPGGRSGESMANRIVKRMVALCRRAGLLRVGWRDALGLKGQLRTSTEHLHDAMDWLCRSQDATGVGGVAFAYSLYPRRGWLAAYPEITGYIIPTFFNYARWSGDEAYRERAIRMAQWEVEVQMPSGAVQGLTVDCPPAPAVFNTGQVLFGWARAFRETGDEQFRKAVIRAADFLVHAQDQDGAWRRHGSRYVRPGVNAYDARTAWGLLEAFRITGKALYREAAVRNLDLVLTQQHANGWFADCCLRDNKRPLLHTIAYAMEGLLEAGLLLDEPRYIEAAGRTAEALLVRQRPDGSLAGRYDASWQPVASWSCLAGDAQTAVVWFRLFELTGADKYLASAKRITRYLRASQDLANRNAGVRGGIKGSYPIWGEYLPYHYPSWAANFFAAALMLESRLRERPIRGTRMIANLEMAPQYSPQTYSAKVSVH